MPVQTPEQEESYQDDSWTNSTPHISDLDTVGEMPVVSKIMSHIYDEPGKFASISGPLLATQVKDTRIITRIPTTELPKPTPKQNSGSLRRVNDTDAHLLSTRTTPNHEFAVVPRQRSTAQLPPHMRLDEDFADSPEHVMPVEMVVNRAIVTFHQEHTRLPHAITISYIRFLQHWINNPRHRHFFFYKTEYGDVEIPINGACMGEFAVDEVRLD